MHRRELVFLDDALRDQDRVLEVVTTPRHERDEDVAAEGELTHLGRRTVGDHVAALHAVAGQHDRPLVHAGVLVGTLVFDEVVDVDARIRRAGELVGLDHDARRIDALDHAVPPGDRRDARIARHHAFHARADQRRVGAEQRHGLPLHVRAHQRPVGVVVLQERDQTRRHRHELVGRHVHEVDFLGHHGGELTRLAHRDGIAGIVALRVDRRVGLRDDVVLFLERREIADTIGDAAALDLAIGGFDEAELVDAGVGRQTGDQADVRSFRSLDRTHAPIVGRTDVAHLEAGTLARETARSECGEPALVRDLGKRIGLIHKLREL